jgi:hypothetical protein
MDKNKCPKLTIPKKVSKIYEFSSFSIKIAKVS